MKYGSEKSMDCLRSSVGVMPAMMQSIWPGVQGLDGADEGQLDGNGLKAEGRGDLLGDEDVDAVGVGAVEALHRDGVIGGLGGLPVVRRVGDLHADAELAALAEGARSVGLGVGGAGVLGLGGRTACGEDRHAPDGQGR